MRHDRRHFMTLLGAVALTVSLTPAMLAQEPSDSPEVAATCAVLTADEVSAALGEPLALVAGQDSDCQFDADFAAGRFLTLHTDLDSGDLAQIKEVIDEGVDLTVAGLPALYLPDSMGTLLYVAPAADTLFNAQLIGDPVDGIDKQEALTELLVIALPRLGPVAVPTAAPVESFATDAELASLFPTEIGGVPITVDTRAGAEGMDLDPADPISQALIATLAAQGKAIDDVSVGYGTTSDGTFIIAIRVRGTDVGLFQGDLIGAFVGGEAPELTTATVAGKAVGTFTVQEEQAYVYPHGDTLWMVTAPDQARIEEVFTKLP